MVECSAETVGRFRTRPEEVSAIQWTGVNWEGVRAFLGETHCCESQESAHSGPLTIRNASGTLLTVRVGDWIIRDQAGFYRPCPAIVFREMYEPVCGTN